MPVPIEKNGFFKKHNLEFQDFHCSENLGIATFTFSGKKIIITKISRITVRKAKDQQNLFDTFAYIINLLTEYKLIPRIWEHE
ncbi:MAG: hypothetical protein ACTSYB_02215 [Candidatus Helarchaeota archaeon]